MHNFKKVIFSIPVAILILAFLVYVLICFYYRLPIVCRNVSKLENMLRIDFSDAEIVDIQSDFDEGGTDIVIYVKADTEYTNNEYFVRTNCTNKDEGLIKWVILNNIRQFEGELSDIYQYGYSFSEIRRGMSYAPFSIYWSEIKKGGNGNANLVFSTWIPRIVRISKSIYS